MRWLKKFAERFPKVDINIDGKPYLTRYLLTHKKYSHDIGCEGGVFLHNFHASDPKPGRGLHNHPWVGTSLILAGGYVEERCTDIGVPSVPGVYTDVVTKTFYPGMVNRIGLHDFHRTTLLNEARGCWTLFFVGERVKDWGFVDPKTWLFTLKEYAPKEYLK